MKYFTPASLGLILALCLNGAPGFAEDDAVIEEVLGILHERGMVDDAEYTRLRQKQEQWEEAHQPLANIEWSGDMRARFEQFWFDRDPLGVDRSNRSRARYRFRLKGKAKINDWITAVFRLASGQNSARSANRTLGFDEDFGPDDFFIDQAYLQIDAPEHWFAGKTQLQFGKMAMPFRWKHSRDTILWDSDIEVEGIALSWSSSDFGSVTPYVRAAYLVADENGRSRDPHVFGVQLGADAELAPDWRAGGRVTHYEWRSLDQAFLDRSSSAGSLRFGLADSEGGGAGLSVTEIAAYVGYSGIQDWPLRFYGHIVKNHDAGSSPLHPGAEDEDMGFGIGMAAGDKRKFVELGAGWFRMEANAWPGQFVDSPLLDGRGNSETLVFHAVREVLVNTDLKASLFIGEADERGSAFANSLSGSDRVLLQVDLMVRF